MSNQKQYPINAAIDKAVSPNEKPEGIKDGSLWATHSGVLQIGDFYLKVHILSNGMRIIDTEDLEKFFPELFNDATK